MAAPIFQRTVVDEQGNIVAGAVVEVRNELTDELAPIFVDRELTDVKANPFTTDSTGFIRFFAAAGDYRIKATFGAEEIIFRFVQLIDTDELIDLDSSQTLSNKTLIEPNIETISNAGLLTLPAATDTLVGRATTDTLTNKTLTSPTINGGNITGITDLAVADGGTGRSTLTANNVLIGDGTSAVNFVAPGDSGNVLTSNGTQWISEPVTAGGVIIATQFEATGTGANIMPVGTTAQRPASPVEGMFRLNTTTTEPEWYDEVSGEWLTFRVEPDRTITADFLVIAGGGGGGRNEGAGGGAGGFRQFTAQALDGATNYTVTVGAGGAGDTDQLGGINGSNSVFNTITSAGGGGGGGGAPGGRDGKAGGSGGGAHRDNTIGAGNTPSTSPSQGNNGGDGSTRSGGGGGGAGAVGGGAGANLGGNGGAGQASSITGTSVTYAGGGGGGAFGTGATGGAGGGGNGSGSNVAGTTGAANTGGGGGGTGSDSLGFSTNGMAGGSGVVIVKYPDTFTITNPGGGLTSSTASAGGFKVTTFTAGTGTIQFN